MEITLTSKGQFTLPMAIRKSLKLKAGDKFIVEQDEYGSVILSPKSSDVKALRSIISYDGPTLSLEDMQRAMEDGFTCL